MFTRLKFPHLTAYPGYLHLGQVFAALYFKNKLIVGPMSNSLAPSMVDIHES